MNCKPGDLAILLRTPPELADQQLEGRIFRLTGLCNCGRDRCFTFEGGPLRGRLRPRETWAWMCLPDAWLRPIRDPGEDATDEMLLVAPSPTKDKETVE